MSLFEGLFPSSAGPVSTLFSEQNVYRRQEEHKKAAKEQKGAPAESVSKKKRKALKEEATALPKASSDLAEQPVAKKARKEKAAKRHSRTEASPAQLAAAGVQRPEQEADKGPSSQLAAAKPQKKQLKTQRNPRLAATGTTPSAEGQKKFAAPQRKAEKASASGPANTNREAEADAGQLVQRPEAASNGTDLHKEEESESDTDAEEPELAKGRKVANGETKPAPAKGRRTDEEKAERLRRTIFVGNLPVKVKTKLIKQTFSQYGTVESVRLRSLPLKDEGKLPRRAAVAAGAVDESRGSANAYVVFSSGASAVHALAHNMREFEGRHIRVDRAAAVSKGTAGGGTQVIYDSARSVFVGNLPFDTQDEELIELFGDGKGGAGNVTAVRVVRDAKTNVGKGIAFVEFIGRPAARMAMAADGRVLRGREIRVTRVAKSGAAAAAAADAAAAGGSRLRTPFSRGVRVREVAGAGPWKGAKSGKAEGTPRAGGPAAWQGMRTKGQQKVVGGFAAKERGVPSGQMGGDGKGPEGKLNGKRPSVAARKEKLLSKKKQKRT